MNATRVCLVFATIFAVAPAWAQSRFLVNDRTNDRIVMLADLDGDGVIDEGSEVWTFFDGANKAGTLPPSNPTALGVSPLGFVVMGDQANRAVYLVRDLNGDMTGQGPGESVVFADMDNASGMSLAFPTGAAFDSHGNIYVSNAGNAFGPDAIYRLTDLNGDGTAQGPGEITVYVGEGAFGPGNGPFVPYTIVFDESDVGYLRNAGSPTLGLVGVYRFEDINGDGRADGDGEFTAFFDQSNKSGIEVGTGFGVDLDRANEGCVYMLNQLSGPTYQLIRLCDLNGDNTAQGEGEAQIVWETTEAGFSAIDLVSLPNGDVLITDNSTGAGTPREIRRLTDLNGDGTFLGEGEEVSFLLNEDGTVGNVREAAIMPRFADLSGDDAVDVFDLLILLGNWGICTAPNNACAGDLNGDGVVDVFDLLLLLGHWGS